MWEVHQPKPGRWHPPAPPAHSFALLPVGPRGLQGEGASLFLGERSGHPLHRHSITWVRPNSQRNWGTCHSVKHSVHIPKRWPHHPATCHQQQSTELLEMLEKKHSCSYGHLIHVDKEEHVACAYSPSAIFYRT